MTLAVGVRLGPYEILAPVGAGGMGEVYRARDTRLGRVVAVKVLSERLAVSPEVRKRFDREARAISSLQHPHICALYDVGREGDTDYLVMELLEGESLAQRLARGPLPISEVLALGSQVADALGMAHGAGIVHRDLKPANILLTGHGAKLFDFGLARLHAVESPVDASQCTAAATDQASDGLTGAGATPGTVHYMAPEQLEGNPATTRSDLFAFGAVLFEMATGRRAFSGDKRAGVVHSILHETPPPVSSLAPAAPRALDRLIATCLAKDPKDRWHDVHDLRLQIDGIAAAAPDAGTTAVPPGPAFGIRRREWLAWGLAAAALFALIATSRVGQAPAAPELVRFQVALPSPIQTVSPPRISPDGRLLAFALADAQGVRQIWIRPLDAVEARRLPGTEGAFVPFWSPDSRRLGFVAGGELRRIAVAGGPAETICDASTWGGDGSWSEEGTIVFVRAAEGVMRRVSADGGAHEPVDAGAGVGWQQFLPGGRKLLYGVLRGHEWKVRIANADGSEAVDVMTSASQVEYAPPGYLLFVRETTLMAQRFDAAAGRLAGDPVPVAEGLAVDALGNAEFSASRNGVLAYRTGRAEVQQYVWLDRQGRPGPPVVELEKSNNFDLSPDGRWMAHDAPGLASRETGVEGFRIWLHDMKRGVTSQFTFDAGDSMCPLFTPDGRELLFVHSRPTRPSRVVARALDGSSGERVLHEDATWPCMETFTPDGRTVLFDRGKGRDTYDLWKLDIRRPASAAPLIASRSSSSRPSVSPDGRWLAFQGNESGRDEVYVTSLAGRGARWQISTRGGREPQWGPDGTELFYVSPEGQLMRVVVRTGESFDAEESQALFAMRVGPTLGRNRFLMAPDGQRFLIQSPKLSGAPVTVVLNWTQALER
ncbi:MAG: protein kinase [Vicinamibacteria bacterium]|nr:protein kinase [Vicinamibacteria bacterium]